MSLHKDNRVKTKASIKKIKSETLSNLSAVQTLLKNYPILNTTDEVDNGGDSFSFMCNILSFFPTKDGKSVQTRIIEWLSNILSGNGVDGVLDKIEYAVKGALFLNFKNLFTCNVNPFIPDEYMLPTTVTNSDGTISRYIDGKGLTLDIAELDFFGLMNICPISEEGKCFYFDAYEEGKKKRDKDGNVKTKRVKNKDTGEYEEVEIGSRYVGGHTPNSLWKSADMNAFLWYVINKGDLSLHTAERYKLFWDDRIYTNKYNREFYNNGDFINEELYSNFFGGDGTKQILSNTYKDEECKVPIDFSDYYKYPYVWIKGGGKKIKKRAIAMFQFDEGTGPGTVGDKLKVYINPYRYASRVFKVPYYYPLKVSAMGVVTEEVEIANRSLGTYATLDEIKSKIKEPNKGDRYTVTNENEDFYWNGSRWRKVTEKKAETNYSKEHSFDSGYKIAKQHKIVSVNHTLMEFNWDYLMSVKIFDSKTLTAQIINAVIGLASSVNFGISVEREIIYGSVAKIVKSVKDAEDTVIEDCFYNFSNDEYDKMLEEAQLKHYEKITLGGNSNDLSTVRREEIREAIDAIDNAPTLEKQKEAIANAFTVASVASDPQDGEHKDWQVNFNFGSGVLDKLLNETVTQIVLQVLSPKIMLLYKMNIMMMGDIDPETGFEKVHFDFKTIYKRLQNMITKMVADIAQIILQELYTYLIGELKGIFEAYNLAILKERIEDYKKLIQSLIENCSISWGTRKASSADAIDNVQVADIVPTQTSPKKDNC